MWDRYGHMHDGWAVGYWLMLLVMIVFVVMLGVTIWLLLRGSAGTGRGGPQQDEGRRSSAAEDLLAERFARGELDEEEYRRRRDTLRL
ncbi:MAG: SHOCT domain-containing protein [Nocardioides sp.]